MLKNGYSKEMRHFHCRKVQNPFKKCSFIAELKIQLYLSLNAIISSTQNLTFTFLFSFNFTFCIVIIPLFKVFGKLQCYDFDSFILK